MSSINAPRLPSAFCSSTVLPPLTPPLGGSLGREAYFEGAQDMRPFQALLGRTFPRELVTLP